MSEIFFSTDPDFCPHCKHIPCVCNRLGAPKSRRSRCAYAFYETPKAAE